MNKYDIKHPIDLHIIALLSRKENMRFIDLKTKNTDTNLLTYHLKQLQSKKYIKKIENAYSLSQNGLIYANNLTKKDINYPNVLVVLLLQNSEGDVLLQKRKEQPYINTWALPEIDVLQTSSSLLNEAKTLLSSLHGPPEDTRHVGTAYIRSGVNDVIITSSLVHVFRLETDNIKPGPGFRWIQPHHLPKERLSPGIEEIVTRSFFGDAFFFEEFKVPAIIPEGNEGL